MTDYTLQEEQAVLGAILQKPEILSDISKITGAEAYFAESHKAIFESMLKLESEGKPLTPIAIAKSNGKTDLRPYLMSMYEGAHAPSAAEYHAKNVLNRYRCRTIKQAALEVADIASKDIENPRELVEVLEKIMFDTLKSDSEYEHISKITAQQFDYLEKINEGEIKAAGINTGFVDIDYILTGIKPGELALLAARPSVGKTALAIDIALNCNVPVGLFSLEMSKSQLGQRVIAKTSETNTHLMRTGNINDSGWKRITQALILLDKKNVYIDDTAFLNLIELRGKVRRMIMQQKIEMVIIDYLQLMSSHEKSENRNAEIGKISRGLKILSGECDIPILALSQLSRSVEQRSDKTPMLSDLRDSGALEQDADVVIFLHRLEGESETDVVIAKNRNGPTGKTKLTYKKEFTKFVNYSSEVGAVPF